MKLSSKLWYCEVKVWCGYKYFYSEKNAEFWRSFFWFWKLDLLLSVQTWCRGWLHKGNAVNTQHETRSLDLGSQIGIFCIRCSSLSLESWKWSWEMSGCDSAVTIKLLLCGCVCFTGCDIPLTCPRQREATLTVPTGDMRRTGWALNTTEKTSSSRPSSVKEFLCVSGKTS